MWLGKGGGRGEAGREYLHSQVHYACDLTPTHAHTFLTATALIFYSLGGFSGGFSRHISIFSSLPYLFTSTLHHLRIFLSLCLTYLFVSLCLPACGFCLPFYILSLTGCVCALLYACLCVRIFFLSGPSVLLSNDLKLPYKFCVTLFSKESSSNLLSICRCLKFMHLAILFYCLVL